MPKTQKNTTKQIPLYLKNIYARLYLNKYIYNFFDNAVVLNILTLGHHHILTEELKKEITPNSNILQIGVTFGSQIEKTYQTIGAYGSYTIVDILPDVLETYREKHLEQHIKLVEANAAKTIKGEFDTIICYMLLHELPPLTRNKILQNIHKSLPVGGKIIFIDYHSPSSFNPLKYFIKAFNRLYQPFAETLWNHAIKNIMPSGDSYQWSQQTYFGGIYQKVIATKIR